MIQEFGKQFPNEAICYHLDPKNGHIVGTVMRRSRGIGSKSKEGLEKYDVAWEFSALGETAVLFTHVLDAHITAQKLFSARAKMKKSESSVLRRITVNVQDTTTFSDDDDCMMVSSR